MVRILRLVEYQTREAVPLAHHERVLLQQADARVTVVPSFAGEGYFDLTPSSWVGAIDLGTLVVEIHPKIPIDRLLILLTYSLDSKRLRRSPMGLTGAASFVEALALAFIHHLRQALGRECSTATVKLRMRRRPCGGGSASTISSGTTSGAFHRPRCSMTSSRSIVRRTAC